MAKGLRRRQSVKASANVRANFTLRRVQRQKFAICVTEGIRGSVERGRIVVDEGWFIKSSSDLEITSRLVYV